MATRRSRKVYPIFWRTRELSFRFTPMLEVLEDRLPPGALQSGELLPEFAEAAANELAVATSTEAWAVNSLRSNRMRVLVLDPNPEEPSRVRATAAGAQPVGSLSAAAVAPEFAGVPGGFSTEVHPSLEALPQVMRSLPLDPLRQPVPRGQAPSGQVLNRSEGVRSTQTPPRPTPFGTNLALAHLTNRNSDNGGGSTTSGPVDQDLIPAGAIWKYLDNGSNQGTAWRNPGFNDSAWASGPAQLGYGDGDESTEVSYGLDPSNKHITTYFRHSFEVSDPTAFQTLQIWLVRDDGAVVYLNGNEIYRSNMPTGTINYQTPAASAVGGDEESAWQHSAIPGTALVAGTNVVAVEIHQANATSSDISFDFDLYGSTAVRFAVLGDYGINSAAEGAVSEIIKSWYVDFVVTTGDNNYPTGSAATINQNIGQYYCPFIRNPDAPANQRCNAGLSTNRFYPTPGNHDWDSTPGLVPYLNYFTLPNSAGNERYYTATWGHVQFFGVDSDPREPSGITSNSTQGNWFRNQLGASEARWKVVAMHHPPYSSASSHGSTPALQWPYQAWGASAVLAGHDHTYERIIRNGFPYFVNGLGGAPRYGFGTPIQGSEARYNANWGAMYVEATTSYLYFAFLDIGYTYADEYLIL